MKFYLDNGYQEFEIEVDFDYQPYERATLYYPGCSESVEINEVRIIETGSEICLLDETEMNERILDKVFLERNVY